MVSVGDMSLRCVPICALSVACVFLFYVALHYRTVGLSLLPPYYCINVYQYLGRSHLVLNPFGLLPAAAKSDSLIKPPPTMRSVDRWIVDMLRMMN